MLEQESSSEEECSLSDEEIWENCSDEETVGSESTKTNSVVVGICRFLNFFQLFHKVSERAILALLLFLRTLFSFVGFNEIALLLPKSLSSIRGVLKSKCQQSRVLEYVVCPKCNSLYLLEHCIIQHNGMEESRVCDIHKYLEGVSVTLLC